MRKDVAAHSTWVNTSIGDIVASDGLFTDGDWVETKDQDPNGTVRLIQLADIGDGSFLDKSTRFLTRAKAHALNCTFLTKGDLLIARLAEPLGRCCIFPLDGDEEYVTVVDVCVVRLGTSAIDPRYVMYAINNPRTRADIETHSSGSTRKRVSRRNLARVTVPLAPRYEQRRIVAKIEELFSELDKGIESLKTARGQLEVYRQSVLNHAFEGKLTAQWREENKDRLKTPELMLARIKKERVVRYEHQLREWKAAAKTWEGSGKRGKRPAKPQNPRNPLCAAASPIHNPFWTRLLLDELAVESVLGKMLDREKNTGTPRRYLGNINLRWGKFDLENLKTMKVEDSEIDRYCLARGDLVICEGGEPGRCAVWEGQEPTMLIQKALHRVRFTEGYSPYFAFYFMTYAAKSGLLSPNLTGSTIKHLTGKGLRNVLFPLCTLAEQEQVVRHLDSIFTLCDELDCQIDDQLLRVNALRQAILKKAFTGQLVLQDPDDEPASILLERIKAAKAARSQNNTRAKRRRTAATA